MKMNYKYVRFKRYPKENAYTCRSKLGDRLGYVYWESDWKIWRFHSIAPLKILRDVESFLEQLPKPEKTE